METVSLPTVRAKIAKLIAHAFRCGDLLFGHVLVLLVQILNNYERLD
jgi:hypothetical protein